jgi:tetratricopeptide (TPR) repeat protein
MNNRELDALILNNTGNKSKESLIEGFVIRTKPFNTIVKELHTKSGKNEFNYLIIGQRGAGKTTLLYRVKYAIQDDPILSAFTIPIMFSEEQYDLMDLVNLWEGIADHLEEYQKFETLSFELSKITEQNFIQREKLIFKALDECVSKNKKKLILFIENIDVFFKKIGHDGQIRLLKILKESSHFRLIGSATTYFESTHNSSDPFYNFFKIIRLEGLSKQESRDLLLKLAEQKNQLPQINKIIEDHPKRLESLRRLTGGNPRIISYLFQIFLDNEDGKAIIDLYKLLDNITPLYKAELDHLSPQQQKIIDIIARNWDAVPTKEISAKTSIDSKQVSSILNLLEKNQVVERIPTTTKNNLYRLQDRLLNIWYLMRFGRKSEKENVIWLVRFYDTWCDKSELHKRVSIYLANIKKGKYDVNAAIDMGNVFLSCENISSEIKLNLYKTTRSFLPDELIKELKLSGASVYDSIRKFIKQKKFKEALDLLDVFPERNEDFLMMATWIHIAQADYSKSKTDYSVATELLEELYKIKPNGEKAFNIGNIYEIILRNKVKAIHYYELALAFDYWEAAYKIGEINYHDLNNIQNAEKYHRLAIANGFDDSIMALATILYDQKRLTECKKIVELAIAKGNKIAKSNLGVIYEELGEIEEAIKTYEEAINSGVDIAIINLADLYMRLEQPDLIKAKEYLDIGITKNIKTAYFIMGKLLTMEGKNNDAEEMFLLGAKSEDSDSSHYLGHLYADNGNWKESEKFFMLSVKYGRKSSLMCLFETAYNSGKNSRRGSVLKKFEENINIVNSKPVYVIKYARLLLWNNEIEKSISTLENIEFLFNDIFEGDNEKRKSRLLKELTLYFILLISKENYTQAYKFFTSSHIQYKVLLRPLYYALMSYLQNTYPNEYLKAGNELLETVEEIIKEIKETKSKIS